MGSIAKMYIAKLILVFCATVATAEKEENNREPRIFAVTTTTSVSSFSTQTLCYSISDATKPLSACAAKRKRRSNKNPIGFEIRKSNDEEIFIAPSLADVDHKNEDYEMILDSSQEDAMVRNGNSSVTGSQQ